MIARKVLITLLLLVSILCLRGAQSEPTRINPHDHLPQKPRQGAELLKTDIMGVFAHPDDETGVAAIMAKYAHADGKVIAHVYCTRGEGGGNMVGTQWGPSLGILREAELRDCLAEIGVRYCFFLECLDWAYTESVAATLQKWDKEETLGRLVRHVRALRPDVIITMNPAPSPGQHGHHQAAAVLATEAFDAAADPNRFPEQITREGLSTWQVRKLYYSGNLATNVATIVTTNLLTDARTPAQIAGRAAAHHRSQGFGDFSGSPFARRPQTMTLVKTAVAVTGPENDLLQGLPASDAKLERIPLSNGTTNDSALQVSFIPRPAVRRYQKWVKEQGIEHVSMKLAADFPVVSGEMQEAEIAMVNHGADTAAGELQLRASEGWRLEKNVLPYSVAPGATTKLVVPITSPINGKPDGEIVATVAGTQIKSVGLAHRVPRGKVTLLKTPPAMNGTSEGWASVPATAISPTDLVQGKVADDADSSAFFRLAHDGATLFVDVDVKDDHVISNIAPNDIRGHWRSDSVEICVDPAAGAEDTMSCFKLGIFPFDTTGVVRAARDADANQGPMEETAPGTRVVSRRTADGYRIQVSIPFRELGISLEKSRRFGFNIIVYDGDKTDASVGENINKSRIAWSPRPGINGRPEDWGRVDLK